MSEENFFFIIPAYTSKNFDFLAARHWNKTYGDKAFQAFFEQATVRNRELMKDTPVVAGDNVADMEAATEAIYRVVLSNLDQYVNTHFAPEAQATYRREVAQLAEKLKAAHDGVVQNIETLTEKLNEAQSTLSFFEDVTSHMARDLRETPANPYVQSELLTLN